MSRRAIIASLFCAFVWIDCAGAEPLPDMKSLNLIPVPTLRQSTDYTCGVCALQAVLAYYGEDRREDELARALKADPTEGTRYQAIADYGEKNGYQVEIKKGASLSDLQERLKKGLPAICLIQAWAENKSQERSKSGAPSPLSAAFDYSADWEDGHYVVAVGYDDERIYFMDPSTTGNYTYIKRDDFLKRWHDTDGHEKLYNFFIVVSKTQGAGVKNHDPDLLTEIK